MPLASARDVQHQVGRVAHLVLLHVSPETLDRLLSEEHPELAVVATWAVSHRHGPRAKQAVMRALEATERLPATLQETQRNAILSLLALRFVCSDM